MSPPRPKPLSPFECPRCGRKGNQPPGFRLEEYPHLEAVFVDTGSRGENEGTLVGDDLPQRLRCLNCDKTVAVARGTIEVRKTEA